MSPWLQRQALTSVQSCSKTHLNSFSMYLTFFNCNTTVRGEGGEVGGCGDVGAE